MKKKLLAVLTCLLLLFSFCGCGQSVLEQLNSVSWPTGESTSNPNTTCTMHTYGSWTTLTEATCERTGTRIRYCIRCNETETEIIPASSHYAINGKCSYCGKITNAYDAFVYYVKQKGTYSNYQYMLTLGHTTYSGVSYGRYAFFDTEDNELYIAILYDEDYYLNIKISKYGGTYSYGLMIDESDYLFGNFYPSTFNSNTDSLTYTSTNLSGSRLSTVRELAASMASLLLTHLDTDISASGISAYDLGFINY